MRVSGQLPGKPLVRQELEGEKERERQREKGGTEGELRREGRSYVCYL